MSLREKTREIPNVLVECNIVMIGNRGVGSSSLIERVVFDRVDGEFVNNPNTVIGQVYFEYKGNRSIANVTAFPSGFDKSIMPMFCKTIGEPDLLIVLFSLSSKQSLDSVKTHMESMCAMLNDVPIVVLGNKSDLENPSVTDANIETARADWPDGTTYLPVSALTGDGARASIAAAISLVKGEEITI